MHSHTAHFYVPPIISSQKQITKMKLSQEFIEWAEYRKEKKSCKGIWFPRSEFAQKLLRPVIAWTSKSWRARLVELDVA